MFAKLPVLTTLAKTMNKKPTTKVFQLNTIIEGQLIQGRVSFSPAPEPGIMTELARFEAERMLTQLVGEDITATSR